MHSQANGHANGRDSEGDTLGSETAVTDRPGAHDDKALRGDAFATAGEWLAARRRALQLSLEEVESATRVREDYLAAIEDMDPRRMPAGPYAPGFVRTYAIHLDLDPEAVTARFREEMSPRRLRTPYVAPQERPPPPKVAIPPRVWGLALGAAVIGGLAALGWLPRSEEEELRVPAVPEGLAEWVAADVQSRRTSAAPELVVGPDLALRARVPVRLEAVTPNGEVLLSRTLEAGEVWTAPRIPGIVVSADNGAAVDVLLDGRAQERMGEAGLPVTDWPADAARGLTPPEPEPEIVEAEPGAEVAAAEEEAETTPAAVDGEAEVVEAVVDDAEQLLEELAAEEALVTPDLPSEPEISVESLPPIIINQGGFVPDPEEAAAAEGREAPPRPVAPLPDEGRAPPPGPAAPDL